MTKKLSFLFFLFSITLFSPILLADQEQSMNEKRQLLESLFKDASRYYEQKQYDSALLALNRAKKIDPDNPKLHTFLGSIYLEYEDSTDKAISEFNKSVQLDPKFAEGYHNLAIIYASRLKDMDLAEEYFTKAVEANPKFDKSLMGLGWLFLNEKHEALTASKYFERLVEVNPAYPEGHYGLAMSYVAAGKSPLAVKEVSILNEMNRSDLASLVETFLENTRNMYIGAQAAESAAKMGQTSPETAGRGQSNAPMQSAPRMSRGSSGETSAERH